MCEPWVTDDDLMGDTACSGRLDGVNGDLIARGLAIAQEVLYRLSGERYPGLCTDVVRPCGQVAAGWRQRWASNGGTLTDWRWNRGWGRCGHAADACGSSTLPRVPLGRYPVASIDAVWIDGDVLDPSAYAVEDRRYLVRVDGDGWPCCQRLDLDYLTADDTFAVEVTYGRAPDAAAVGALMTYAPEVILALCPGDTDCRLPARVQSITRQGITATIIDPLDFLDEGRTGIPVIDAWLKAVNPKGRRGVARVTAPTGKPVTRLAYPGS